MKREGLAASSSAQASQPSRPANFFLFSQCARIRPMSQPSTPLTPTRPSASPAVAACRAPPVSFPIHLPRAHASTARATEGRQRWQERARGSRPGHSLVPLAPRPRNLAPPSDASHALPPHDAVRHWSLELGYKSPTSVALAPFHRPAATLWPSTAHPS